MVAKGNLKILYVSNGDFTELDLPRVFQQALQIYGTLTVHTNYTGTAKELCGLLQTHHVYLICRHSLKVPDELVHNAGELKVIVATIGSLKPYLTSRLIESEIPVCNWGDAPAEEVAQGALTLLLSTLSDLHHHIAFRERGGWTVDASSHGGKLYGEHVGLYGYGFIAQRFVELLRPFRCTIHVYDPYIVFLPPDLVREHTLQALFSKCRIISIHAGLTDETRYSVGSELLSLLPQDGVIVNTARGGIIDQKALFAELEKGRLRAGLDVLDDPDSLPPEHPARRWENLILTGHQIHLDWPRHGHPPCTLTKAQQYALDNLEAICSDTPLKWRVTPFQFARMT
jgi:phosphoglycerate dehydrogenase-like enzyme